MSLLSLFSIGNRPNDRNYIDLRDYRNCIQVDRQSAVCSLFKKINMRFKKSYVNKIYVIQILRTFIICSRLVSEVFVIWFVNVSFSVKL